MRLALLLLFTVVAASCVLAHPLLDRVVPPPPHRHIAEIQQAANNDHSLLATATTTTTSTDAAAALESSLVLSDRLISSSRVSDSVTAAGELSVAEQALIQRMIPVPKTEIPSDRAKPIEYLVPPTADQGKLRGDGARYPWPEKIQNALTTVENAAKKRIGKIKREAKWQEAATKLVNELSLKRSKVSTHVAHLTSEIKDLLAKKKQIQNKQLQDKLVKRLEQTHRNLKRVRNQNHYIRKNEAKMLHHKEQLSKSLEGIKRSLALLKGFKRARKFPDIGTARKRLDQLDKYDPVLSNEDEQIEVQKLRFPDQVFAETESEAQTETETESESEAETDAEIDAAAAEE